MVQVTPGNARIYAGRLVTLVWKSGRRMKATLARQQMHDHAVTIAQWTSSGYEMHDIDFDELDHLEIDGPRNTHDPG